MSLSFTLTGCGLSLGINLDDDEDNDGVASDKDCNDNDPAIRPGVAEILFDGQDQNCNGMNDEDADGDGQTIHNGDCDDTKPYVFSGAVEFQDAIDDDCDGEVDEPNELSESLTAESDHPNQAQETTVASGDLNGDGFPEVIVGATEADGEEARAGLIQIISGGDQQRAVQGMNSTDRPDTLFGNSENDRFGSAIAAGDVNGDGADELAVGAKGVDGNGNASGAVALYRGGALFGENTYDSADTILYGSEPFASAGAAIAFSDLDADGFDDLIVGAYGMNGNRGDVSILFGREEFASEGVLEEVADSVIEGEVEDDRFGWSLSGGFDVNGDGFEDFVVGAPANSTNYLKAGAAYLYFGSENGVRGDFIVFYGENEYDQAGYSVALVQDVDGDGLDDVLIGAPGNDAYGDNTGRVYLVKGRTQFGSEESLSDADATFSGSTENQQLGFAVAGIQDYNADGFGDVSMSGLVDENLNKQGAIYLYLGAPSLAPQLTSSQADAFFINSSFEGTQLMANGAGQFDGQIYSQMGPYADFAVSYTTPNENTTWTHVVMGQETKHE